MSSEPVGYHRHVGAAVNVRRGQPHLGSVALACRGQVATARLTARPRPRSVQLEVGALITSANRPPGYKRRRAARGPAPRMGAHFVADAMAGLAGAHTAKPIAHPVGSRCTPVPRGRWLSPEVSAGLCASAVQGAAGAVLAAMA